MAGKNGNVTPFAAPAPAPELPKEVISLPVDWLQTAVALVKLLNIHEGHWRVMVQFGDLAAVNGRFKVGAGEAQAVPMAMVPVVGLHLRRVEKPDELSVDAALVNPRPALIHKPFFG